MGCAVGSGSGPGRGGAAARCCMGFACQGWVFEVGVDLVGKSKGMLVWEGWGDDADQGGIGDVVYVLEDSLEVHKMVVLEDLLFGPPEASGVLGRQGPW
jgi:hypothetical protein